MNHIRFATYVPTLPARSLHLVSDTCAPRARRNVDTQGAWRQEKVEEEEEEQQQQEEETEEQDRGMRVKSRKNNNNIII